jgi:phospholipid/cholesterol/gamma-HCH transport system substrate-binding protein
MKSQTFNKAKLGAFVLIAITCFVLGLYYIGNKKNIFHSTITVSADFDNVGGLLSGNNVRFNGINVGTVTEVYAISDSTIKVEFTIDKGETKFISQSAIASIGTDGLLGNKLIDISPGLQNMSPIEEGNTMKAVNPIKIDNTMRTLNLTNDNLKMISDNLKDVSDKVNNSHSLWNLLTDSVLTENVRNAVVKFKTTGENTAILTADLNKIVKDINAGKGTIGALIADTMFSHRLNQTINNFESVSDSMAIITRNFQSISENLKNGQGAIGTLLTDTTFVSNLNQSMMNIKNGTDNFNQDMEALKHSWPFKKYFRKNKKMDE